MLLKIELPEAKQAPKLNDDANFSILWCGIIVARNFKDDPHKTFYTPQSEYGLTHWYIHGQKIITPF